jgi:hypothetical protein
VPTPRWYVDADTLGLAKVLVQVRKDVTYPGDEGKRHRKHWEIDPCVISDTATEDQVWIPLLTRAGLAIITRDRHIQERTGEKDAVVAARGRMFAITSNEQLDNWGLLEVVATQWRAMERAAAEPGPYIYSMTRTSLAKIDL